MKTRWWLDAKAAMCFAFNCIGPGRWTEIKYHLKSKPSVRVGGLEQFVAINLFAEPIRAEPSQAKRLSGVILTEERTIVKVE